MTTVLRQLRDSSRRFGDSFSEQRDLSPNELFSRGVDDGWWSTSQTASGRRVTDEQAERMSAVFACIDLIATTHGMLPSGVITGPGTDSLGQQDWMTEPTPDMTWQSWVEQQATAGLSRGEAFAFVVADPRTGVPAEMWPLDPRRVDVRRPLNQSRPQRGLGRRVAYSNEVEFDIYLENGDWIRNVPRFSRTKGTDAGIMHIPARMRAGSMRGISPIEHAAEQIGLSLAAEEHGARFFSNGANPGFVISYPTDAPDPVEQARFKRRWNEDHQGVAKSSKIGILGGGATITPMTIPHQHAQFLETRRFQVEEIARLYRVPPHMIAANERQSTTGTSIEHQQITFATHTMGPHLRRLEMVLKRWVLLPDERFWHDTKALLRADTKTRMESNQIRIASGQSTINEIRREEGDTPIGPNGDQVFVPLNNLVPLDRVSEVIDAQIARGQIGAGNNDPTASPQGGRPSSGGPTDGEEEDE